MGKEAKYIVMHERNMITGEPEDVIYPFNKNLIHRNVALRIGGELGPNRVKGAGFIVFTADGPRCYGKSTSLRVECRREEDNKLARLAFGDEY